ncbi:MAG: CBS domain-containing protein [Actinobacteria bacterium]|nr:CBS domain-containing protein [Actinomycetota bacterium]
MITVRQLLANKPPVVWTVGPQASVYEALELMATKDIGAVLVVEGARVVGILSERDYARGVALEGKTSRKMTVAELMTSQVLYVRSEHTINDCMSLMTNKRVRHLPVLDGERLIGIVTIGDVVKQIISEQESRIQELENYIRGS